MYTLIVVLLYKHSFKWVKCAYRCSASYMAHDDICKLRKYTLDIILSNHYAHCVYHGNISNIDRFIVISLQLNYVVCFNQ